MALPTSKMVALKWWVIKDKVVGIPLKLPELKVRPKLGAMGSYKFKDKMSITDEFFAY